MDRHATAATAAALVRALSGYPLPSNSVFACPLAVQCGHEAPAGFGGSDEEGEQAQQGVTTEPGQPRSHKRSREEGEEEGEGALQEAPGAAQQAQQAQHTQQAQGRQLAATEAAAHPQPWRPQADLPRERKIAVGQLCKRLIDAARLRWLRRQGFEASLVKYVPSSVSGENRLLVAAVRAADEAA